MHVKGRKGAKRGERRRESEGAPLPPPLAAAVLAPEMAGQGVGRAERAWRGQRGHALLPKFLVRMGALAVGVLECKQPAGPICVRWKPRAQQIGLRKIQWQGKQQKD